MRYAAAALWIALSWALRRLRFPARWVHQVEDQASMRMFACSREFETSAPAGGR